ncbi:CPBP family intramembrane metalloprotease [Microbulbifer salipaludis]|uniref:CPBP family intramembrane metalloprotease n=1 Tax=Microbulbifer salipaludis TaxID=187980 RepID=A0ABS3E7X0_9GAMM|nr:CPBP family intramembrane glutamic endopeptidase [Microbulbifer salipaludis]MBN8431404.1 CPBP family intramembrane metalloprotease [Microbulbifer salipaludis]
MTQETIIGVKTKLDKYTVLALVVSLILYPLLYSLDFFSEFIFPLAAEGWPYNVFEEDARSGWWWFWTGNFFYHWVPALFVWLCLYKNKETWESIGVSLAWYAKRKYSITGVIVALVVAAFVLPDIYYGDNLPQHSQTIYFAPISTNERLFMIVMAITTGVTEEVLFRGFAFTRLKRLINNPWLILPITLVSFLLIHGQPDNLGRSLHYIIGGCAFGISFILFKLKRLELLIVVHFFINASLALAP